MSTPRKPNDAEESEPVEAKPQTKPDEPPPQGESKAEEVVYHRPRPAG